MSELETAIENYDRIANEIADERNAFKAALKRIANWKTYRGWSQELDAEYETDDERHLQQAYEHGANDAIKTLAEIARAALQETDK